jgi:hypothetical protein
MELGSVSLAPWRSGPLSQQYAEFSQEGKIKGKSKAWQGKRVDEDSQRSNADGDQIRSD